MEIVKTELPGVLLIKPRGFSDNRGCFYEGYHRLKYSEQGITTQFVQDNISYSTQGVLRGLHYQLQHAQDKLVSVIRGDVFDVAIDIRLGSPYFGRWIGFRLNDKNRYQLFIPKGFAHGFCVLSPNADFLYKCSDYYYPNSEYGIAWNDPELAIAWPIANPCLSSKDAQYPYLKAIQSAHLPHYQENL